MKKKKLGRPSSGRPRDKSRQIGRVPDDVWDSLKKASEKSGLSFTQWSLTILCREANITRKFY